MISYLETLKAAAASRQNRVDLLRKFPIFCLEIRVNGNKERLFRSMVLPKFQYSYSASSLNPNINDSLTELRMDASEELITQSFFKIFNKCYNLHIKLYTDDFKSIQMAVVGAIVHVPCLNKSIKHKFFTEAFIFTVEAWIQLETVGIIEEFR